MGGCEAVFKFERNAQSPQEFVKSNIPVMLYKTIQRQEVGGACGEEVVCDPTGRQCSLIPITCTVTRKVHFKNASFDVRVQFPKEARLNENQKETLIAQFFNRDEQGFLKIYVISDVHRYNNERTKEVPIRFGEMNTVQLMLEAKK